MTLRTFFLFLSDDAVEDGACLSRRHPNYIDRTLKHIYLSIDFKQTQTMEISQNVKALGTHYFSYNLLPYLANATATFKLLRYYVIQVVTNLKKHFA